MASKVDYQVASLAAGFSLGFGFLTVWEAMKQTRDQVNPLRSAYIWMVWGEIVANLVIGILAYLYLEGLIGSTVPTLLFILICWVFEIQLLMQIIVNRIAIISESRNTAKKIRWGAFAIISTINVLVFCIFIPAHLDPPTAEIFVRINTYWDKISKVLICSVDAALNWYFVTTVRKRLVQYHGLRKYAPLINFNAKLLVVSVCMDLMILGLMFMPNQIVFIQFHPVAYMVKLNIEMSMANLIRRLARINSSEAQMDSSFARRYGYGAGTGVGRGHSEPAVGAMRGDNVGDHELKYYAEATVKGPASDASSEIHGIHKTVDYEVTVHNAPAPSGAGRSDMEMERGKTSSPTMEDELSLARNAGHPGVQN